MQCGARTGHGVYTDMLGNKLYANLDDDFVSKNPVIDWPEFTSIMNEIYEDIDRLNFKQFIQGIENPNLKRNIEDLEVDIKRCQVIYTIVGGINIVEVGKIGHLKARVFSPVELELIIMVIGKGS